MRVTASSFFATAKSTFMSSNDLQSNSLMTEAWGEQSGAKCTLPTRADAESVAGSELAANTEQILAGGSMSILRRKGKQNSNKKKGGRV